MHRHVRSHPLSTTLALVCAFGLAACGGSDAPTGTSGSTTPTAAPPPSGQDSTSAPMYDRGGNDNGSVNEKFEFGPVTFSDGSVGTIRAGSKITNKGAFTTCGYFTIDEAFLGQFASADFASSDADAVRQFCLDHFADRTS